MLCGGAHRPLKRQGVNAAAESDSGMTARVNYLWMTDNLGELCRAGRGPGSANASGEIGPSRRSRSSCARTAPRGPLVVAFRHFLLRRVVYLMFNFKIHRPLRRSEENTSEVQSLM